MPRAPRRYQVYVIELDPGALPPRQRALRRPPRAVYVGQTAHTPEQRFTQHMAGGMLANGRVRRHGVRLRYDLFPAENPVRTRAEAERLEREVAEALAAAGYVVFWG